MSTKIINPITGRPISINSTTYNKLIKDGFVLDPTSNKLLPAIIPATASPALHVNTPNVPIVIGPPIVVGQPPPTNVSTVVPLTLDDLSPKSLGYDDQHFDHIVHISDIHIPIHLHIERKDEYLTVFNRLYESINTIKKSHNNIAIVITGDLLHVKLNIEPETIILARTFLESLTKIAPTILIIGNHDFAENNLQRADAMTAVCHGIHISCLKFTGLYRLGNVLFSFSSLFDQKFIRRSDIITTNGGPIYKLFHGTVIGSINCNGRANQQSHHGNYHSLSDFEGYDAVLLGHIHLYQKLAPNIAYAGSLIQQNYGEPIENHGFLVWDLKTHTHTFHHVDNDFIYIDAIVDKGLITNQSQIDNYKTKTLRVRCKNTNTTASQYTQIQNQLQLGYKIHEIKTANPIHLPNSTHNPNTSTETEKELEITLIKQYAKPPLIDHIIKLHNVLRSDVTTSNESSVWNITHLRFKNVFFYGNDHVNTIDFINGVHNICSPNMTGKTSIVCIIAYALYDRTSYNSSNKTDIIHKGKNEGFIELTINKNGQTYIIEKYGHSMTRKGEQSIIFSTDFYRLENNHRVCLNGASVTNTCSIISDTFGDFDLFIAHHIISTKFGYSLIQMTSADKLKHFHSLCGTNRYEQCLNECKKLHKKDSIALENLNGQLSFLQKSILNVDQDLLHNNLLSLNKQLQDIDAQLAHYMEQSQSLATQSGHIDAQITSLQDSYDPMISKPLYSR